MRNKKSDSAGEALDDIIVAVINHSVDDRWHTGTNKEAADKVIAFIDSQQAEINRLKEFEWMYKSLCK